ncbi:MAG: transcriptional repressor NrdR [Kiritimatiellae bacterium]|nr:transcriptional repressor NrdR [Kiritimatiellia bacterium]MBR6735100.1 transcriptional repressor NrdR [Kiritimatiellia bacterium]
MKCPKCGNDDDKVLDSRSSKEGAVVRRRRECLKCGHRFTTHEEIDRDDLFVVKRDGRREVFQREKLEKSVRIACQKRPIPEAKVQDLIGGVMSALEGEEVASDQIGRLVMERLHELDEVAYIRFASVYRRFTDVNQFLSAITEMVKK